MSNAANEVRLFEVNLISDQVSVLLRRRAFQQLASVAMVLMLAVGTILAVIMAVNLTKALRMRSGILGTQRTVEHEQKTCADLDQLRETAIKRADAIAPLLPIARQRIAWASKLAAVAADLTPGTGLRDVQASQRDIFVVRPPARPGQTVFVDETGLPQMSISLLCAPSAGGVVNLAAFTERLDKDETFKDKFDFVRLTAMELDTWANKPVDVLHIHAKGSPK